MSNGATSKPERLKEEWAKLDLASSMTRGRANLQEAALIVMNVRPESTQTGKLPTRTALAPFGCEEVEIRFAERKDRSAWELVEPKFPVETMIDEQGPSMSGKNKADEMTKNKKAVSWKNQ